MRSACLLAGDMLSHPKNSSLLRFVTIMMPASDQIAEEPVLGSARRLGCQNCGSSAAGELGPD